MARNYRNGSEARAASKALKQIEIERNKGNNGGRHKKRRKRDHFPHTARPDYDIRQAFQQLNRLADENDGVYLDTCAFGVLPANDDVQERLIEDARSFRSAATLPIMLRSVRNYELACRLFQDLLARPNIHIINHMLLEIKGRMIEKPHEAIMETRISNCLKDSCVRRIKGLEEAVSESNARFKIAGIMKNPLISYIYQLLPKESRAIEVHRSAQVQISKGPSQMSGPDRYLIAVPFSTGLTTGQNNAIVSLDRHIPFLLRHLQYKLNNGMVFPKDLVSLPLHKTRLAAYTIRTDEKEVILTQREELTYDPKTTVTSGPSLPTVSE